jgi:transposase
MTRRYAVRDDQWARLGPLLPGRVGYVGGTARDHRLFGEAVRYRYRAGLPWRELPERFGGGKNTHPRFSRWAHSGVGARLFAGCSAAAANAYALIDATSVRAHPHSAGARKKGMPTRRSGGAGVAGARRFTRRRTRWASQPPATAPAGRRRTWPGRTNCCRTASPRR